MNESIYVQLNKEYEYKTLVGGETNTTKTTVLDDTIYVDAKIDVDKVEEEIASCLADYKSIMNEFTDIKADISRLDTACIKNASKINEVYAELSQKLADDITKVNASLKAIVDVKLPDLESRLNEQIKELADKIDAVHSDISAIKGLIDSVKADVEAVKGIVNTLSENVTTMEKKIADLEQKIKSSSEGLDELWQYIHVQVETRITKLESDVVEIFKQLDSQKSEYTSSINQLRHDMTVKIESTETRLNQSISDTKTELNDTIATTKKYLNDKIDAVDTGLDFLGDAHRDLENAFNKLSDNVGILTDNVDSIQTLMWEKADSLYYDSEGKYDPLGKGTPYWWMMSKDKPLPIAGPYDFGTGGKIPTEYLKKAVVSGNTLTIIDADGNTTTFTPEGKSYVAGANIQINDRTISATDTVYDDTDIKNRMYSAEQKIDEVEDKIDNKQGKLTAGANVFIDNNNVISATDTTYTAGENISIVGNVISTTAKHIAIFG